MRVRFSKLHTAIRSAIRRRGGGWRGALSLANRGLDVFQALGWKGFIARLKGAVQPVRQPAPPAAMLDLASPTPIGGVELRVGVMAHLFYADLVDEFSHYISAIPVPVVLMVSVVDRESHDIASAAFSKLDNVRTLHVRIVPNRGRDIAPFLVEFRDEVLGLDLVCHIHTKKSLYSGGEQSEWRTYLLQSLLGSKSRVSWIIGTFHAMPDLGIVYPETHACLPLSAHTWLSNKGTGRELGASLGLDVDTEMYVDYPAGSMFWARVASIKPLFALGLSTESFPPEAGQTDGTLQHAIERLFVPVSRQQGYLTGILPADGSLQMTAEGDRNWASHFGLSARKKILLDSADADIASFDVFDTLVLRAFLRPSGVRQYLAHIVASRFDFDNFGALREIAEQGARNRHGRDPTLTEIYSELARFNETRDINIEDIRLTELRLEQRILRPRTSIVDAAKQIRSSGKHVFGLSDMYITSTELADVLPAEVQQLAIPLLVSCDTGKRKDSGEAWTGLIAETGINPKRWLHTGDNEHSDIQVPRNAGLKEPVHLLRPASLLEVVPALRALRPTAEQSGWQNQLWLGLLANRFSQLADVQPEAFKQSIALDSPELLGYVVLGPLVLDYLAWVSRTSLAEGSDQIMFFSREGHALQRAFLAFNRYGMLDKPTGTYFLTSRRASGMASAFVADDLVSLLKGSFNGTLHQLLAARMGRDAAGIARRELGDDALARQMLLPEMLHVVADMIDAIKDPLLELARNERETYLEYWERTASPGAIAVCDLGYAGTIQSHLSRMTGRPLSGKYFALDGRAAGTPLHGGTASARFHDGRAAKDGEASPILRHDLLLEALLTAPDGQLSHFIDSADGPQPVYAHQPMEPALYANIELVHCGLEYFITDVGNIVGQDIIDLAFDPTLVQQPLECLGTGVWRLPPSLGFLTVDDRHTGRGDVRISEST